MTAWSGNQRGDNADEVVVHVARIAQSGGAGGHDCRDQLVGLFERGIHDMQPVGGNPGEGSIVKDDLRS